MRFGRIKFGVRGEFPRQIRLGINGFDRAFRHAGGAIDAILRVDDQLIVQFVKTGNRTDLCAIGEFAPPAFVGNNMSHNLKSLG